MASMTQLEGEHAALQSALDSVYLRRAPSLARILTYICDQHFQGKADEIKEYNIAVEALGKSPEFDQKASSLVRVEMHRLRKRLQQYYANEGADSPIEITIPEGSYVPLFLTREGLGTARERTPSAAGGKHTSVRSRFLLPAIAGGLAAVLAVLFLVRANVQSAPAGEAVAAVAPVPAVGAERTIRILAGRDPGSYSDRFGRVWSGDTHFTGGRPVTTTYAPVARAMDQLLYKTMREGGSIRYDIPLPAGTYEMRLYFAETIYGPGNPGSGGETYRVFQVRANGVPLLRNFDVIADAPGANVEDVRVFTGISPASDGQLHVELSSAGNRAAFLNGLEITPGRAEGMLPLRFVASDNIFFDSTGAAWLPDWFTTGGILADRAWAERGDPSAALHRSERFGNFGYSIPVAPGRYVVRLHFAEAWFGPDLPGGGGTGQRLFHIYCNGEALTKNFDIFRQAGGSKRKLVREFRNVEPNPQGKIVLSFVPVVNYAAINALEILPEAGR